MPRSVGMFRRAGFRGRGLSGGLAHARAVRPAAPVHRLAEGLRRTDTAVREWVGLVAYRLAGKTSELFPGP